MSISISGNGTFTGVSTNYSFDQSVSIAGTVTYEDVTNVDSVGIITANAGIDISNTIVANNDSTIRYDNDTFHVKVDANNVRGSSTFKLDVDDTNAITIDDNRRIGIGTDNPICKLVINSGTTDLAAQIVSDDANVFLAFKDGNSTGNQQVQIGGVGNTCVVYAGGSERVRIGDLGNTGIGVVNPEDFHVKARTLVLANGGDDVGVTLDCNTNKEGSIYFADGSTGDNLRRGQIVYNHDGDSLRIVTNASERMRIDSSGDVGIGTNSAALRLHVQDTVSQIIRFSRTAIGAGSLDIDIDGNAVFNSHTNNKSVVFHTQTTERARIDSDGRLLVGLGATDTNANTILQGSSGGSTGAARLFLQRGSAPSNGQALSDIYFADDKGGQGAAIRAVREAGTWTQGSSHPTRFSFQTTADSESSPTEHMVIDSSGRFYYNKTGFSVSANGFMHTGGTVYATIPSSNTYHVYSTNTDSYKFYVNENGGISNFSANNSNLSDQREKKNILSIGTKWNDLKSLNIKEFHYNHEDDSDHKHIGVIAQDVESSFPENMTEWQKSDTETRKGVKESQFFWLAIKALQEAQTRIETLEQRLTDAGL